MVLRRRAALRFPVLVTIALSTMLAFPATGALGQVTGSHRAVPSGTELWRAPLGGASFGSMGVAPDGTIFVTGGRDGDIRTAALDPADGARIWSKGYDGALHGDDIARSLAVSPDGDRIFVTGAVDGFGDETDIVTIAYDAGTGTRLWLKRYNGPADGFDEGTSVSISPDGETVFVGGGSLGTDDFFDAVTIAYDASDGTRPWVRRYDGPAGGDDGVAATAVSPDGGTLFVTGTSASDAASGASDYVTIAYATTTGTPVWTKRYHAGFSDQASSLAVSPDGDAVFVTGSIESSVSGAISENYGTLAYSTGDGSLLWDEAYDGPASGFDLGKSVDVSPDGASVVVTGLSQQDTSPTTLYDYATVRYDATTGEPAWSKRYDGPGNGSDQAAAVRVSPDGRRVFVTGSSSGGTATIAYRLGSGDRVWRARDEGGDAAALATSSNGGRVFVTGIPTLAYRA